MDKVKYSDYNIEDLKQRRKSYGSGIEICRSGDGIDTSIGSKVCFPGRTLSPDEAIAFAENLCHIHRKRCGDNALYSRVAELADISVGHCKAGGTACRHPAQAGLAPGADECPWFLHSRRGRFGDFDPGCSEIKRH